MVCASCKKESAQFEWDESSHLGKRPICYSCIHDREIRRLKEYKPINLYLEKDKLVNQVRSMYFKIIEKKESNGVTRLYFLVDKKRWEGVLYAQISNRVVCTKYKAK